MQWNGRRFIRLARKERDTTGQSHSRSSTRTHRDIQLSGRRPCCLVGMRFRGVDVGRRTPEAATEQHQQKQPGRQDKEHRGSFRSPKHMLVFPRPFPPCFCVVLRERYIVKLAGECCFTDPEVVDEWRRLLKANMFGRREWRDLLTSLREVPHHPHHDEEQDIIREQKSCVQSDAGRCLNLVAREKATREDSGDSR